MLPSVLQRSTTDHVPVLADEARRLLAVRPGETVVDCTFGAGGHAVLLAADLQGRGRYIAIDRDPTVKEYFESFKRGAGGLQTRLLRGEFSLVLEQLAGKRRRGRRDPDRPRRLVDAARSARARFLVRDGCAARHAHGSLGRADRGRPREREHREGARGHLQAVRGGALRAADRARDRPQPAARDDVRARGRDQVVDPRARALRFGASGKTRLPGVAHRRQRRARFARGGVAGCARHAAPGRAARGDQLPFARGPHREDVHARRGRRLHLPAGLPRRASAATSRRCAPCRAGRSGRPPTRSR